jgi:hypothetical protein
MNWGPRPGRQDRCPGRAASAMRLETRLLGSGWLGPRNAAIARLSLLVTCSVISPSIRAVPHGVCVRPHTYCLPPGERRCRGLQADLELRPRIPAIVSAWKLPDLRRWVLSVRTSDVVASLLLPDKTRASPRR